MKEVKEKAVKQTEGKASLVEETACAKALRWYVLDMLMVWQGAEQGCSRERERTERCIRTKLCRPSWAVIRTLSSVLGG